MEAILQTTIEAICKRTFCSVAPADTPAPWVTWQQTGGRDVSYVDNANAKRHARVQINVWAATLMQAAAIRDQIEAALRPLESITCTPSAAHHMTYDTETKLHGVQQVWEIWV